MRTFMAKCHICLRLSGRRSPVARAPWQLVRELSFQQRTYKQLGKMERGSWIIHRVQAEIVLGYITFMQKYGEIY